MARLGLRPSVDLSLIGTIEVIERKQSTWGRADVIEALTVALPTRNVKAARGLRQAVEAGADLVLAHRDVVQLTCPDRPNLRHGSVRYSTWWTLQTEQAVLDAVEAGRTAGAAIAPTYRILPEAALGDDQAEAVQRLCSGGERVAVLIGPAGSGKSRSLNAARQAWEAAGNQVRGVAASAVAAGVLCEQAGIPSETLAKFLLDSSRAT